MKGKIEMQIFEKDFFENKNLEKIYEYFINKENIFLKKNNFSQIIKYINLNCKEEFEAKEEIAKLLTKNIFLFRGKWDMERTNKPYEFKNKIIWNFYPENDPEWTFMLNRNKFWETLSISYLVTHEKKYLNTWLVQQKSWIDQNKEHGLKQYKKNINFINEKKFYKRVIKNIKNILENKIGKKADTWRTIDIALRCETWIRVLEIFKNEKIEKKLFFEIMSLIKIQGDYLLKNYEETFRPISNWGTIQNYVLYLIGAYFPELKDSRLFKEIGLERLKQNLELQICDDGMHIEQAFLYHNEVLHSCLGVINIMQKLKIETPKWLVEKTRAMLYANLNLMKPNGHQPLLGDSDDTNIRDILTKGAVLLNDEKLKKYGLKKIDLECLLFLGDDCIKKYEELKENELGYTSVVMKNSGNSVLRSGWNKEDNYLFFHNGFFGGGHSHSQALHFELYGEEEEFIVDSGRYTYVDSKIRRSLKSVFYHNTVVVDKKDCRKPISSWSFKNTPELLNTYYNFDKEIEYIENSHLGYFNLIKPVILIRKILFLKPDIYLMIDEGISRGTHLYQQYFNFNTQGKIEKDNNRIIYQGKNSMLEFYALSNVEIKIENSILSKEYNKIEKNKKIITSLKSKGNTSIISLFYLKKLRNNFNIKIKKLPIYQQNNKKVSESEAEGILIEKNDIKYKIFINHHENIKNKFYKMDGNFIFGKVIVIKEIMKEKKIIKLKM
ncbi:heparinase II/III family protein [Fusobacterium varium]